MRRSAIVLPLLLTAALVGCVPNGDDEAGPDSLVASMPAAADSEPNGSATVVVFLRLHVWVVEVPSGMISRSEDLWSYLDEEQVGPQRQAALGRNGLRVGVAPGEAWEDISQILREMTGSQIRRSQLASLPGRTLDLVLRENAPAATIFTSREDRTLTGADYPRGDYVLALTATVDVHDPSFVVITAVPQIRSAREVPRYVGSGENYRLLMSGERIAFENLMFQLSLSENDIMVIGPGSQSRRTTSIGRNFLVRESEGISFEKVLVIRPEMDVTRR
ncbi:MAG: hypothetical protein ACP5HU_06340 [Phycisphaerae bacterium]